MTPEANRDVVAVEATNERTCIKSDSKATGKGISIADCSWLALNNKATQTNERDYIHHAQPADITEEAVTTADIRKDPYGDPLVKSHETTV